MDFAILDWIQENLRCGILDSVMKAITSLGDGGKIWVICTVVLLLIPRTRKAGLAMALALALNVLFCNVLLKPLVARPRPCDVNPAVQLLIERPLDYSFPSGHTASSFAAAFALYFSGKKLWIPVTILAGLIGFSRLYLYVHYPSDVLAGALIGVMLGWLGAALAKGAALRLVGRGLAGH